MSESDPFAGLERFTDTRRTGLRPAPFPAPAPVVVAGGGNRIRPKRRHTVELLHFRDSDYECDLHLVVDGIEFPMEQIQYVDIDPGRGYDRDDWNEHRKTAIKDLSTKCAKRLARTLFDAADESKYIGG